MLVDPFGGSGGGRAGALESEDESEEESEPELLSDSDEDSSTDRMLEFMYTFFLPVSSHLTTQPSENLWLARKMVPRTPFLEPLVATTRWAGANVGSPPLSLLGGGGAGFFHSFLRGNERLSLRVPFDLRFESPFLTWARSTIFFGGGTGFFTDLRDLADLRDLTDLRDCEWNSYA